MDGSLGKGRTGRDLVGLLAVIVRTSQIHDPRNVAVYSAVEKFVSGVNAFMLEESAIEMEVVGEYFYLNGERVKFTTEHLLNFDFLQREFKRRRLGSVKFLCDVRPEDVQAFLGAFISSQFAAEPFEDLQEKTEKLKCIAVGAPRRIAEGPGKNGPSDGPEDIRKAVKHTYFNAVSFTMGVMNKIKAGERISMRKAKRVVERMVDALLESEELILGMTVIKNYDEYTFHHSVNVSILSVALGQRLGMAKKTLMELGMVALFHDIGKTVIPSEILNKPGAFDEEEWKLMVRHPLFGVKIIFNMKSFDFTSIRAAIASYEHHIHPDGSGYPAAKRLAELDLFSRIVAIADQYDAMTSSRVYARAPLPPDGALALMVKRSGPQLDPLLMKFFVNLAGVYPIGTLVMLDTRELGVVTGTNAAERLRPSVTVITDANGNRSAPMVVDLAEKNGAGGYLRSIARTVDHNKHGINLAQYFL
ncbi:MAG: HD-GYP domain-containing protein [Nitrospiraceae bacterium]|nr:HD-GYP domain-containing protein [Nitrospiraceae bacterium]